MTKQERKLVNIIKKHKTPLGLFLLIEGTFVLKCFKNIFKDDIVADNSTTHLCYSIPIKK